MGVRRKPRSIRSKIMLVLLVPIVASVALWTWEMSTSVAEATALRDTYNTRDNVILPTDRLVAALQSERGRSVEVLAAGAGEATAARAVTDAAFADFRKLSQRYEGDGISADIARARIADLVRTGDSLALLRAQVDARDAARTTVLSGYNGIISYAFSVSTAAAVSSEPLVERVMKTMIALRRAGELLYQEDALVTGATTAGRFAPGEHRQLIEIVGGLRFQIPTAGSTLPAPNQAQFKSMLSSEPFAALRAAEDQIIGSAEAGGSLTMTRGVWRSTFDPPVRALYAFLSDGYNQAVRFAKEARDRIVFRFTTSGLLGLLAILASLLLSVRVGGSVVRRLSVLRTAANDLAHQRLPDLVRRLRAGERVDAGTLRTSLTDNALGDDEIAEVGAALSEVQQSALSSAANEASLRYDMNKVLVNIARRNQTLVARQLEALAHKDETSSVRAQQLAVRMRRNAEHLVILAGSARSRRGLGPERLDRIVTRTAGEVEHGERIEVGVISDAEVPESAVGDIGHLLAELLENALTFSPPETRVLVRGHGLPGGGFVLAIEDSGLGMSAAALEETNRRLAQPQEFDPADSARLGLFVVALLAAQRGIRVSLQASGGRGVTATVQLPAALALPVSAPAAGPRRADASKLVGAITRSRRSTTPRHAADEDPAS
jgi:signal transduction histidine kinase